MFKNKNHKDKLINISELIKIINLRNDDGKNIKAHTLRFWEKKFTQIKPQILSGKRRYYSKKQIEIIKLIKFLLKDKGMTVNGVKNVLKSKINRLDVYNSISLKADYQKQNIKDKSRKLLEKLKKIKNNG